LKHSLELIETERVVEYEYMQQQQQQVMRFVVLKGIEEEDDDVIIILHTTKDSTNNNQFECTKCTNTYCYHLKLLKCIKDMESYGIIGEGGIKRVKPTMNEYLELLLFKLFK
jgi:pyruvate-formate lyase-activating enzyme